MTTDRPQEPQERLIEELDNFEEIARYLNPSPGEIPELPGVDICGVSIPLRREIGGDHLIYIDFNRRYNLDAQHSPSARAKAAGTMPWPKSFEEVKQRGRASCSPMYPGTG